MDEASPWQNVRRHTPRPTETNRRNSRVAGYSDTPLPTSNPPPPPPYPTTHPLTSLPPHFPIPHPHERTPNPRSLVSLPPYTQVRLAAARRRGSKPGAAARVGWQLGHGSNRGFWAQGVWASGLWPSVLWPEQENTISCIVTKNICFSTAQHLSYVEL